MKLIICFNLCLFLLFSGLSVQAVDDYKPYLHDAVVPEQPEMKLSGQYKTNLFSGSATYSYLFEVPQGTNKLQPFLGIVYNSLLVKQRPGIIGAGWLLTQNLIYREMNLTYSNTTENGFNYDLILEGIPYQLVYNPNDGFWHTEVESYFKIENLTGGQDWYWRLTKKDGTRYRFGYNADSELTSNTGKNYALKWSLDQVQDVYGNTMSYSYLEDPQPEDNGTQYLDRIVYNNNGERRIEFTYESSARPDRRLVYEEGNLLEESRRLTDISTFVNGGLVKRYHLNYVTLSSSLSSLTNILEYGTDNNSLRHNLSFEYHLPRGGYNITDIWVPPIVFAHYVVPQDQGVRLEDFNNDGLVDIVKAISNTKVTYLNNGSGWNKTGVLLPENIVGRTGETYYDNGLRFAEVNGDGFIDFVMGRSGQELSVYLNNKHVNWTKQDWQLPWYIITDTLPDAGVRLVDLNGDNKIDLTRAKTSFPTSERGTWIGNGSGWYRQDSWNLPVDVIGSTGEDDFGVRFLDLNGDGLPDLLQSSEGSSTKQAWLNNGTGWVNYTSIWEPPIYFTNNIYQEIGVRFADVNGDGLTDIIEPQPEANSTDGVRRAYINSGHGWVWESEWRIPENFLYDGENKGRRLADINGDGIVDFAVAYPGQDKQYVKINNYSLPYLLKSIKNEYGGITTLNYTYSTLFNNSEYGYCELGFNVFVVNNVTTNHNMTGNFSLASSISYNYSWGKYDYDTNEFLGFGFSAEKTPSSLIYHYFHQDLARRGKEYLTEIYHHNYTLFSKVRKFMNVTFAGNVYNTTLDTVTSFLYDGTEEAKITNQSFTYDAQGNLLTMTERGDVAVLGDEKFQNYTYGKNESNWILDRITIARVYDDAYNLVKETKYYYDYLAFGKIGAQGALTETEQGNDQGDDIYTYYRYSAQGNLINQTDSLGNSILYTYDNTSTFPTNITNALGHITSREYELGTGNLLWEEKDNVRTRFEYDKFGRIVKEIKPLDTSESPTKAYAYVFDGVAPELIVISVKNFTNSTSNLSYYYDGFANLVQLKTDWGEQEIVKTIFYNGLGRVQAVQNPYFAAKTSGLSAVSEEEKTYYTYDTLDRVIGVLNPDGTTKNVTFDHGNITDRDENGNEHLYSLNAYDEIIDVYEPGNYRTSYFYDANGNLIRIIDNEGNVFQFGYDSLSRKISMDDPDLGNWTYQYDQNNNLILQTDSRGKTINLTYDALNRVLFKNSSDVNIAFAYDLVYKGTLSNITQNLVNISYSYDDRRRVIKETKKIAGSSFSVDYAYDSQDRMVSKNGFNSLGYVFNQLGKVQKIPGFVTSAYFNPFGSLANRTFGNNLIQNFTYEPENKRLINLDLPSVQDLSYTYDNVGNILTINDAVNSRLQTMSYDSLDRMISAIIGSDEYSYVYNSTGSIMSSAKNGDVKSFTYAGGHAPTKVVIS